MPQIKRIDGGGLFLRAKPQRKREISEEEYEDRLDYCAAAEAIDEALETHEIRSFEDFAKEIGI